MDHFGIGLAMRNMALMYIQSARRTGRTTLLVASLKDGDRVAFASSREAQYVYRMCRERGVTIETLVVPPTRPEEVLDSLPPKGRLIFDHTWVEQSYLAAIERTQRAIDHFEREASHLEEF